MLLVLLSAPLLFVSTPAPDLNSNPKDEAKVQANKLAKTIYKDVRHFWSLGLNPTRKCEECYEELGCYNMCNGSLSHTRLFPFTPHKISTIFKLYSRYGLQAFETTALPELNLIFSVVSFPLKDFRMLDSQFDL